VFHFDFGRPPFFPFSFAALAFRSLFFDPPRNPRIEAGEGISAPHFVHLLVTAQIKTKAQGLASVFFEGRSIVRKCFT
tara:strand:+ start:277 stop:510 length:234 start_codon:yes stop_codon:yes gene_type:complete